MIYTVTLNPSLDYIADVENFQLGKVNRTCGEMICPGGKGINVSVVLKNLGLDSTLLGFCAGFTGREIISRTAEMGLTQRFIMLKEGTSRINFKLRLGEETEINGMGPIVSEEALGALFECLDMIKNGDILVLAGSVPGSCSSSLYADILRHLEGRGVRCVVDATGELLSNALCEKPFLVKPNNHELGEIFKVKLTTREQVIPYGMKLKEMGACNVLVSMAGDGAVLIDDEYGVHVANAPSGRVVNSVGAGDSMVAGFIYGYTTTGDYAKALDYAIAAGSASAFSEGLATKKAVLDLLPEQLVQGLV